MLDFIFYSLKKHNIVWFKVPFSKHINISALRLCYIQLKKIHYASAPILPKLNSTVFVIGTNNNERVLKPIYDQLDVKLYSIIDLRRFNYYFYWNRIHFISCIFSLSFILQYFFSSKKDRLVYADHFNEIFFTFGNLEAAKRIYKSSKINTIVLSNDHSSPYRSLLKYSSSYNVDTIYLQHCSIGYHFPELHFTYSFLDGLETFEKYKRIGEISGVIFLIGNPRFDIISNYKNKKVKSGYIGIASNLLDDEQSIIRTCKYLIDNGYNRIYLRPHPNQELKKLSWFVENNILISNSKIENPFDYLSKIDILISGESGIHLDASLMGVMSICYMFDGKEPADWYAYIKNGLIKYIDTLENLKNELDIFENYTPNQELLKYYCSSVGTTWDGKIANLIKDFILYKNSCNINNFISKYNFKLIESTSTYSLYSI